MNEADQNIMQSKPAQGFSVDRIWAIVRKRRWLIIIPFMIAMIAGITLAIRLPKVYQASTLIFIQPQKVPTSYIQSIVSTDISSRLDTISQQILSRTNLEKIIKEFDLFSKPDAARMYIEDKIEALRRQISVQVAKSSRRSEGPDSFTISFKGEDPVKVMRIVNTLGTFFINENLKTREAQALGTSDFLEEELGALRKHLEGLEEKIKTYREHYMGALPEQLETNLRVLDRLQMQMTSKQEALIDAKNRLISLEKQISEQAEQAAAESVAPAVSVSPDAAVVPGDDKTRLERMKLKLDSLLAKYTQKHPDVIRLSKEIKDLEDKLEREQAQAVAGAEPSATASDRPSGRAKTRPITEDQRLRLNERDELKAEINSLNLEISKTIDQSRLYQKRVEDTPKREQELLSLQRDYDNVKQTYDSLLSRKLEAQMAVNMEKKQKGEQFRIVDSARVPTKPIEPDMKKLFLISIVAGLGLGGGLIYLLEFLDTSFKRSDEVESYYGFPVLATIPALEKPGNKLLKRLNLVTSTFFVLLSGVLMAGFALLTLKGVDQVLVLVRKLIAYSS